MKTPKSLGRFFAVATVNWNRLFDHRIKFVFITKLPESFKYV